MASILKRKNGRKAIQICCPDGRRPTINLGKVDMEAAKTAKHFIESIASRRWSGSEPTAPQVDWLNKLSDELHDRLSSADIVDARVQEPDAPVTTLEAFTKDYIAKRTDLGPSTVTKYDNTRRFLVEFFDADRDIAAINAAETEDWQRWMKRYVWKRDSDGKPLKVLAEATVSKHTKRAKTMFSYAVKAELIDASPFDDLKGGDESNGERDYFVERDEAKQILESCPDHMFRLIFALARYGGFRVCEMLALEWNHMDWENHFIRLPKVKTKARDVPMFEELRPYLDEAYERAPDGQTRILARFDGRANLDTMMDRHIVTAGVKPWPKTFQNLRGTRRTELEDEYPNHVCNAWVGHSKKVARKHYLQTNEKAIRHHIMKAIGADEKALQNRMQQGTESGGRERQNCSA
ncbi:MAG: tyrosine-type recombinase/integrase [Planctomycetota bacterium]